MWNTLGQAATVAQLVGADVGGLISMIIQAAVTAQQNKKECQDRSAVYRLVLAGRQAERFRDVQSRIDSYLFVFPMISHLDITRRLDRIYSILVPNDTPGPSTSAFSMPQIAVQDSHQDAPRIDWKELYEVQEFTFKELAKATNNFDPDKKIGQGGFGRVYMGSLLPDGREVAIKRCDKSSAQGMEEYRTEVTVLGPITTSTSSVFLDTVACSRRSASLDHQLLDPSSPVTASWKMRIEILLGVSRAIEYLQSYAERPMIHRDVKPSNILLDASWMPRLSDFGVALKWEGSDFREDIIGTPGYVAPEYYTSGILNLKTDVYSFGVVMLEVLTGKRVYSPREKWVENKREACEEEEREACEEEEQKRDECQEESDEENFAHAPFRSLVETD